MVRDMVINSEDEAFTVALSLPQGVTLAASPVGTATIPGDPDALPACESLPYDLQRCEAAEQWLLRSSDGAECLLGAVSLS